MDIELLRNFLEIARLGSMTKAASSLHISQPTLSVQMKSLEEVLGRKLFRKEGRNLVMTEEGELLERRAADIIGLTDKTLSEFRALSDSLGGDVRIGCAESVLIDHLALAVKKIKKKRPFLRCHITSGDTAIVTSILEQGLIDFAIIVEPPDLDRYDSIRIPGVDTWCAVIPEDSPLAAKKSLTFDYIKNEPIIMSKQSFLADLPRWCGSRRDELTIFGYLNLFYNGTPLRQKSHGHPSHLRGTCRIRKRPCRPSPFTRPFQPHVHRLEKAPDLLSRREGPPGNPSGKCRKRTCQ